ncbi:hypothetical protein T4A_9556 [Trichinella pseudospiralis]|uniref:Uncharacterized protein n=1 Tax=Trichinella pseudospiralis TaxID=6337 RepID=A0A0V1DN66_TRIPS|nr:hypothetical protein T4A_9556 [Trichinella pseudospiralis]
MCDQIHSGFGISSDQLTSFLKNNKIFTFRDALMAMAFDGSFSRWVTYREIRKWCKV